MLRTDRPTHAEFPSDDTAIGRLLRKFFDTDTAASFGRQAAPERIYLALATQCNGIHFRSTGQMLAWPSNAALGKRTGMGQAIIYRILQQLEEDGLITEVTIQMHGRPVRGYLIHECESLTRGTESRHITRRRFSTDVEVSARARRIATSTPVEAGARAGRTKQLFHTLLGAGASETTKIELDRFETTTVSQARAITPLTRIEANVVVASTAQALEDEGVSAGVSIELATVYPRQRIDDVIAMSRATQPDNPGGFIRDALTKNWPFPQEQARARAEEVAAKAKAFAERKAAELAEERRQAIAEQEAEDARDSLIAGLPPERLAQLAQIVLDNEPDAAVAKILANRPPGQSRLMKIRIAALIAQQLPTTRGTP